MKDDSKKRPKNKNLRTLEVEVYKKEILRTFSRSRRRKMKRLYHSRQISVDAYVTFVDKLF